MTVSTPDEQKVYEVIRERGCVNELLIAYALPRIDVFTVIRTLVNRGIVERLRQGRRG